MRKDLEWNINDWTTKRVLWTSKDWNQTLLTKINQCSAQIFREVGKADTIEVSPNILHVFESMDYYDRHVMVLSGRYKLIVNKDWVSVVKVYKQNNSHIYKVIEILGLEPLSMKNYMFLSLRR